MKIRLEDLKNGAKQEMIKVIEDFENIQKIIKCPQGELKNPEIDCCNCVKCLKYALNKSIEIDRKSVSEIIEHSNDIKERLFENR